MNHYIVIDITTGSTLGCILATSLRSAQCLSPKLFGYGRFNRVYALS